MIARTAFAEITAVIRVYNSAFADIQLDDDEDEEYFLGEEESGEEESGDEESGDEEEESE